MTELTGIGAELRRARESQGLTVTDVAQQLKFAPRQIESLESEHFDRLPGATIARGMVRNYARLLNLDAEPLLQRLSPKVETPQGSAQLEQRFRQAVPFSDSARSSTAVYAGFSLAVLVLAGVVAYSWQQERAAPQFVAPAQPQRAPEPETVPAVAPAAPVAQPPVSEPSAAAPIPENAVEKPEKKQPAEKAEKSDKSKPVAAGGVHRVVLRTEEEAWLEVRDASGRTLVSSLNPPGGERVVRARGPLELVLGNAAHVTLIVDDRPVDLKPHTRGAVARLRIP